MDRRAFLFSTAWLAVAPAPDLVQDAERLAGDAAPAQSSDTVFDAWLETFVAKAAAQGLAEPQVRGALQGVSPDPDVIARDRRQPEFSKPVSAYIEATASPAQAAAGQDQLLQARSWLDPIVLTYQSRAQVLVSIWSVESGFGRFQGDDDVIRSMATLAAEGRRREFAESELIGALRILFSGEASRSQLKGSWAGAMGQTQFTPLDYLAYAVDADGDGRRDIWASSADALGSTANFLMKKAHWRPGQSTQIEVVLPKQGFDYALLDGPAKTAAEWAALGVATAAGASVSEADSEAPATLLLPMGWRGPAFLALPNHMAIRAYNNSTAYALAVGLLADRIGGAGPLAQAWPQDQPISLDDRIAAQRTLIALGDYEGAADGRFGSATRKAAQKWQARSGLPADGYLSYDLVQQLKAQGAGLPAPATPPAGGTSVPSGD